MRGLDQVQRAAAPARADHARAEASFDLACVRDQGVGFRPAHFVVDSQALVRRVQHVAGARQIVGREPPGEFANARVFSSHVTHAPEARGFDAAAELLQIAGQFGAKSNAAQQVLALRSAMLSFQQAKAKAFAEGGPFGGFALALMAATSFAPIFAGRFSTSLRPIEELSTTLRRK